MTLPTWMSTILPHLTLGMLLHYLGKLKIQNFCCCGRKRKQIAFLISCNFVIHQQILIFSVFKIANLFFIMIANKILHVTVLLLTYLLLRSICGIANSSQQTSLQRLSTFNMVFSNEDKNLFLKVCI